MEAHICQEITPQSITVFDFTCNIRYPSLILILSVALMISVLLSIWLLLLSYLQIIGVWRFNNLFFMKLKLERRFFTCSHI